MTTQFRGDRQKKRMEGPVRQRERENWIEPVGSAVRLGRSNNCFRSHADFVDCFGQTFNESITNENTFIRK